MTGSSTYDVVIEWDGNGAWIARIPSVRGCHTYARTLEQARRRIRESLSLWVDRADDADLVFKVRLPTRARREVQRAVAARKRSLEASREALEATRRAATDLTASFGLPLRDAAELLEVSHRRVQQLLEGQKETGSARRETEAFEQLQHYGAGKAANRGIRTDADVERVIDETRQVEKRRRG